jgi:tetratricopeptide (TPR) repeat protein
MPLVKLCVTNKQRVICMNPRECRKTSLWLTLGAIAVLALSLSGCRNAAAAKAQHLQRGEALLAEKKFHEASLEFRNALQYDEKSAAAHWGLARVFEGLERYSDAFISLRKAAELDPNNLDARCKLGHYYLAPKELRPDFVQAAERLAGEVFAKDPNHIEGHILMSAVRLAQNRHDEARRYMLRAVELNPQRSESQLALARFYLKLGDKNNAIAAFNKAIEVGGNSATPHIELGKYHTQEGRLDQAEAAFRKAVEVEPNNKYAHLTLASFFFATRQLDKAEKAYQALADADKGPESRAALADFYAANGQLEAAANTYQQLLQQFPDYERGRTRLGEILLSRGDLAGATQQADALFAKNDTTPAAHLLRGRIRLQNNDFRGALDDLQEALKAEPSMRDALYYTALAHFRSGQMEQASTYTNELEQRYPDDLPGKLMRLQIKIANGDNRDTLESSNQLLARIDEAVKQGDLLPQTASDLRGRVLTARATVYLQAQNFAAARQDFAAARDGQPNTPDAYTNLALLARKEKNWKEAADLYEKALAIDNDNFDAWSGYIAVAAELKTLGGVQGRIEQIAAAQPNNAALQYLRGQAYAAEDKNSEAEGAFQRSLSLDESYLPARTGLAALYLNQGQDDRALEQYKAIIARRPNDANTFVLMGLVEDRRSNFDAAAEAYRQALENNPNHPIAANNLAWICAEYNKGSLDEAMRLAQLATRVKPDILSYFDTLGWVYYRKGMNTAAVEQLQKVVQKANGNALYRYHLGAALAKAGRREEARRELGMALQLGKDNFSKISETRQLLAQLN